MMRVLGIALLAGAMFLAVVITAACATYLMDFGVRLLTNDRYEVISKARR